MKDDDRRPEDIAGLFQKFGGDPHAYQEFAPSIEPDRSANPWPLVSALRSGTTTAAPGQPVSTLPSQLAKPQPPQPVASPQVVPLRVAMPAGGSPVPAQGPRELDALFARLAGAAPTPVATGHGLLSQWRRQP